MHSRTYLYGVVVVIGQNNHVTRHTLCTPAVGKYVHTVFDGESVTDQRDGDIHGDTSERQDEDKTKYKVDHLGTTPTVPP